MAGDEFHHIKASANRHTSALSIVRCVCEGLRKGIDSDFVKLYAGRNRKSEIGFLIDSDVNLVVGCLITSSYQYPSPHVLNKEHCGENHLAVDFAFCLVEFEFE